ncbi:MULTISPECIES: hypothetical protein [Brevibacterium]|uniref:DUF1453 domain-containing protein n=1 Tax=Brevibacterium metallidurans TaxID=1482676 RepID=A0ABN0SQG3_9MICO|nr:hypothetical protein [Brevibacterium sp. W7.2]
MNLSTVPWMSIVDVLLIAVVLALILFRQLSWRSAARMTRIAVVVIIIGVASLPLQLQGSKASLVSAMLVIALTVLVSLAGGWVMGRLSAVETDAAGQVRVRGGWLGVGLWIGFIIVRIGMNVGIAALISPQLVSVTGLFLISLGLARLTSTQIAVQRAHSGLTHTVPAAAQSGQ